MLRIFLLYRAMIIAQKQKNSLSNIKEHSCNSEIMPIE